MTIAVIVAVYLVNVAFIEPAGSCYGPCITADIDKTQVTINGSVTVTGQVCPPEQNLTIRVDFTRPDYSYIEQYVLTDPQTGNFTVTQKLDVPGYWNIFAVNGALSDRLYAQVTDPSNPNLTPPPPVIPLTYKPNYAVFGVAAALIIVAIASVTFGLKKQDNKNKFAQISSSNRLIVL